MPSLSGDGINEILSEEFNDFKRAEAISFCRLQLHNEVRFLSFVSCFHTIRMNDGKD